MLSVYVPNTVKELLNTVKPCFEDRLKNEFSHQGVRQMRNGNVDIQLDNVFAVDGNVNIELSNLNITEATLCTLNNLQVDLETFNIKLQAKIEHIAISGDFTEAYINTLVPMSRSGKITFRLEDIRIGGNIGIYIVEDSFMTKNYDLNMKAHKIISKVTCNNENFESTETDIEKTLVKYISAQILNLYFIDEILLNQLSEPLVECSVGELLLDEPEEMRLLCSKRISEANRMSDSLVTHMNTFMETSSKSILETPALNIYIDNNGTRVICNTGNGQLKKLSFERWGDFSFYENEGVQYIYGYIKLKQFLFKYPTFTIRNETGIKGGTKVTAFRNQFFIKLSLRQDQNSIKMAVEKIQAARLLDIDFEPVNLDSLGVDNEQVEHHVIASIRGFVFPLLEHKIREALTEAIKTKQK